MNLVAPFLLSTTSLVASTKSLAPILMSVTLNTSPEWNGMCARGCCFTKDNLTKPLIIIPESIEGEEEAQLASIEDPKNKKMGEQMNSSSVEKNVGSICST